MKNFRRSKRALSPVVASIILIAVTVAVSIAVAAWMGALSVGFMSTEQLSVTTCDFSDPDAFILTVRNTGATDIIVTQNALVNGVPATLAADVPVAKNTNETITVPYTWTAGNSYQIKLVSQKGTNFVYSVVAGP